MKRREPKWMPDRHQRRVERSKRRNRERGVRDAYEARSMLRTSNNFPGF